MTSESKRDTLIENGEEPHNHMTISNSTHSQDNPMTTLFIDNGISIILEDYMKDPISAFNKKPPMFVASSVGERLAIAEFTGNIGTLHAIGEWMTTNLTPSQILVVGRTYNATWDGIHRANPNGWAK